MRGLVRAHTWDVIFPTRADLSVYYEGLGMSVRSIAKLLGVSQTPVDRAMKEYGIERKPRKPVLIGSNNPQWRGDRAGYKALHLRVASERGQPMYCTICKCSGPEYKYEWANMSGDYTDINSYKRLCVSCHRILDADRRKRG